MEGSSSREQEQIKNKQILKYLEDLMVNKVTELQEMRKENIEWTKKMTRLRESTKKQLRIVNKSGE